MTIAEAKKIQQYHFSNSNGGVMLPVYASNISEAIIRLKEKLNLDDISDFVCDGVYPVPEGNEYNNYTIIIYVFKNKDGSKVVIRSKHFLDAVLSLPKGEFYLSGLSVVEE